MKKQEQQKEQAIFDIWLAHGNCTIQEAEEAFYEALFELELKSLISKAL